MDLIADLLHDEIHFKDDMGGQVRNGKIAELLPSTPEFCSPNGKSSVRQSMSQNRGTMHPMRNPRVQTD